jgi:probable HAF family extracellular repeat protein
MMNPWRLSVLGTFMILVGGGTAVAQTHHVYTVEDLGSFDGGDLVGVAVNNTGVVTGTAVMSNGSLHAFRWTRDGGLEDLGPEVATASQGFAINDNGDVVGVYFDPNWVRQSFIASPGATLRNLTPDVFQVSGITNDGRLTGMSSSGRAFRTLVDGTLQDLSGFISFGADMNAAGDVTGWGWHDGGLIEPETAFRYSDRGGYEDLGTLGGSRSYGYGINDRGIVVGTSEIVPDRVGRAFRAAPGRLMEDLGALPGGFAGGSSSAMSINTHGEIVGQSDNPFGWTAFVYDDVEGMLDLRSRIPIADRLGRGLQWGRDINDNGQIVVGYDGYDSVSGAYRYGTVLLTPARDAGAPHATPTATPSMLTPPDGRMISVSVDPHVTDLYDPEPICQITSVANSEAPQSGPDSDIQITGLLSVNLRAKRLGSNVGRIYTVTLSCTNYVGNVSTAWVAVTVPHDSSK